MTASFVWLVAAAGTAVVLAAWWRLFTRAGEPGVLALVPGPNIYLLCRIAVLPEWFAGVFLLPLLNWGLLDGLVRLDRWATAHRHFDAGMMFSALAVTLAILLPVTLLISVAALGVLSVHVARAFGRTALFGVGLWLAPFVFYPILALDNPKHFTGPLIPGRCHECGYSLDGLSVIACPECGTIVPKLAADAPGDRSRGDPGQPVGERSHAASPWRRRAYAALFLPLIGLFLAALHVGAVSAVFVGLLLLLVGWMAWGRRFSIPRR